MSLFNPELPTKEKPVQQHPWANRIKEAYSNRIKYAHNSIRNPIYPVKKQEHSNAGRAQFTVIGDRITKEFIFCVNLVKGLHKYRKKSFDAPIIRGVTTVEWPSVWHDLKLRFSGLAYCLQSSVAVLINDKFLGGEKELKELVETKYIYHLCLDYYTESVSEFAKFVRSSGRPCAYMHISIDDTHIGTLIYMLYSDILPHTCENFLRLCKQTKGGYSGTPIHRIVKDGWVQGGGFGLKEIPLCSENFIVPHDRRGVLCMANAGRHIEGSTQFFVLLQPAPWMDQKYVAFGQLIEGMETLEKIENVPTWYESPMSEIIIYQAGIFNMECHNFIINKGTNLYLQSHIEDLYAFGELIWEHLMEIVFLTAQLREIERLKEQEGEGEHEPEETASGVRETARFNRRKEDIEKQLQTSKTEGRVPVSVSKPVSAVSRSSVKSNENNDFDVDTYEYEPEESMYRHQSLPETPSLIVKPEKPFYLPLTDVPYPGEKDSDFNLRRFLCGDYCLESDLINDADTVIPKERSSFPSDLFDFEEEIDESAEDMDSEDEREVKKYLKSFVDRVSFAGDTIKNIARGKGKLNIFDGSRKSELVRDDDIRKLRVASIDSQIPEHDPRQVSISVPSSEDHHTKIKRRETGFVRPADLERIREMRSEQSLDEEQTEETDNIFSGVRKVRIAPSADARSTGRRPVRRPTAFMSQAQIPDDRDSDSDSGKSGLVRLFDDVTAEEEPPTLKNYKPTSETHQKILNFSPNIRIKSDESTREKYRHSITVAGNSYEHLLNLQHGKKISRKISTDYVNTLEQIGHRLENSIRSVEFAKTRPAMSVADYQLKNKKYQEENRNVQ